MDILMNYFFPAPVPTSRCSEVSVCITRGNQMKVITLDEIKQTTDKTKLHTLREQIENHVSQTMDEDECANGNLLLEEIERKLTSQ